MTSSFDVGEMYLDLLKRMLTRVDYVDELHKEYRPSGLKAPIILALQRWLEKRRIEIVNTVDRGRSIRTMGRDWPGQAETMIGLVRLNNVQRCIEQVLRDGVPGDLIETGVWRGGTVILMRAVLAVNGVTDRTIWVADSFAGLPAPDVAKFPKDVGSNLHEEKILSVSLDTVKENFARYGLLDERVKFLEGWFKDTLPKAPIESLSILRLDGDLYQSTMEALQALEPILSVGGFVIVDDYGAISACAQAVDDYRNSCKIDSPIIGIDGHGVYWRKT